MESDNKIIELLSQPSALENLYHESPQQFVAWLTDAINLHPGSETLAVWEARLSYRPSVGVYSAGSSLPFVFLLSLLATFLTKIPAFFSVSEAWFRPRFAILIVVSALIGYFLAAGMHSLRMRVRIVAGIAVCVLIVALLPDSRQSASITMAIIHMPLLLLSLLAMAFMGEEWKSAEARLRYIRYLGETSIYAALILLGGVLLTLLTFSLFKLTGLSIRNWYLNNVIAWGLVSAPLIATYLYDRVLLRDSRIAAIIANVFSPLFLITIVVYLLMMLLAQISPFNDRDFLITFNGLLVLVWGIAVFSISERRASLGFVARDMVNIALIGVTLIVDLIAVSAILFRLFEYGITPNRIVVTGANILMFVHLAIILATYIRQVSKSKDAGSFSQAIANFLPAYSLWSIFVVAVLPVLFSFR